MLSHLIKQIACRLKWSTWLDQTVVTSPIDFHYILPSSLGYTVCTLIKPIWRETLPYGHQFGTKLAFCILHNKLGQQQMHCKEFFLPLHHWERPTLLSVKTNHSVPLTSFQFLIGMRNSKARDGQPSLITPFEALAQSSFVEN